MGRFREVLCFFIWSLYFHSLRDEQVTNLDLYPSFSPLLQVGSRGCVRPMYPPVLPKPEEAGVLVESVGRGMLLPTPTVHGSRVYDSLILGFGTASLSIYAVSIY